MSAKLHIDLSQGIISIEGDPDLVGEIYQDFRDNLAKPREEPRPQQTERNTVSVNGLAKTETQKRTKSRSRSVARKKSESAEGGSVASPISPKLDKTIDTSRLMEFYGRYSPKNNSEKILVFSQFLIEELGIELPNTDQIFTLFKKNGEKIPKVFAQSFHDAGSKYGYIDFNASAGTAEVTIAGQNHISHDMKKLNDD